MSGPSHSATGALARADAWLHRNPSLSADPSWDANDALEVLAGLTNPVQPPALEWSHSVSEPLEPYWYDHTHHSFIRLTPVARQAVTNYLRHVHLIVGMSAASRCAVQQRMAVQQFAALNGPALAHEHTSAMRDDFEPMSEAEWDVWADEAETFVAQRTASPEAIEDALPDTPRTVGPISLEELGISGSSKMLRRSR
jgi:hypothetical protein